MNSRTKNGNARRKVRAWLRAQGLSCAICGKPIDYSLPSGHPDSFECDEVVPVSRYWLRVYNNQQSCWAGPYASAEQAALARENVQATHRYCNQLKGNKVTKDVDDTTPIVRSRRW